MKTLTYSDWKRQIAFDNIVYKDVKRYSLSLPINERLIMDEQINFYRKYFSILQVMTHFKKIRKKEDKETFIKAVLKRQDNILYIPNELRLHLKKKIKEEFPDYQAFFEILLEKGLNKPDINLTNTMLKKTFGKHWGFIKRKINKYSKQKEIPCIQKKLKIESYENRARDLIHAYQNNLQLATIFGRSSIRKSIPISVVNEYGYGEWISKNISFNTNRFFLYSNNNQLTDLALEHMVNLNVYPGYGHFYNTILDDNLKINFDSGATYLINGWAMFASCHSKSSAFEINSLIEGSIIAKHLMKPKLAKSYERILVYLLGKYPKNKAMDFMLDYTQYPCHYLSYVLGAFAIQSTIAKGFAHSPVDFLETLRTIDCGDYFALYHPKEQKKIARRNITAKVSNKFAK